MLARIASTVTCLVAASLLVGCHAGNSSTLSARPEPSLPRMDLTTTEAIKRHNLNAERIVALRAQPSITFTSPGGGGAGSGQLALERPRDFRLKMKAASVGEVADIGSNQDEFWFWARAKAKRDNNVYVCSYDDLDRSPMPSTFQPDWIVEALGLRTITSDEAARMIAKPGDRYGTTKLISSRRSKTGESFTKETIVDPAGKILEHRLKDASNGALLASATVEEYQQVSLPDSADTVVLPKHFILEWIPEQMKLDIRLDRAVVHNEFTADQRKTYFDEPTIPGTARIDLAQVPPPAGGPSARRRTTSSAANLPPLPSGSGPRTRSSRAIPGREEIDLGPPVSLEADSAPSDRPSRPASTDGPEIGRSLRSYSSRVDTSRDTDR